MCPLGENSVWVHYVNMVFLISSVTLLLKQCCTSWAIAWNLKSGLKPQRDTTNICSYRSGQLLWTLSKPFCSERNHMRFLQQTHFGRRAALFLSLSHSFWSPWDTLKESVLSPAEQEGEMLLTTPVLTHLPCLQIDRGVCMCVCVWNVRHVYLTCSAFKDWKWVVALRNVSKGECASGQARAQDNSAFYSRKSVITN